LAAATARCRGLGNGFPSGAVFCANWQYPASDIIKRLIGRAVDVFVSEGSQVLAAAFNSQGEATDISYLCQRSVPGYGFSDKPVKHDSIFQVHDLWGRLMSEKLGYPKFGAHDGDWGSTVTEQLARSHPGSVIAIHLTDVPASRKVLRTG
jgi:hypothetical protein